MHCPDEKRISSYLDEELSSGARREIERHISRCDPCLDLLLVAYEASSGQRKCPSVLKQRAKNRLGLKEKKANKETKWLLAALTLFLCSFAFRRFFLQFLAAASILGFKWVMEGEGARRAVMIFRGIQNERTPDSDSNPARRIH